VDLKTTPGTSVPLEAISKDVLDKLGTHEAALIDNRIVMFKSENLKEYSFVTTATPKRERIDYVSRLSEKTEQEALNKLIEEYSPNQGQQKRIITQFKRSIKEFESGIIQIETDAVKEMESLNKFKQELLSNITVEVMNQDQLKKWKDNFDKYYEGMIECLCIENSLEIPIELKEEINNKQEILWTYFEDFLHSKVD
jgi:hypothetical protein